MLGCVLQKSSRKLDSERTNIFPFNTDLFPKRNKQSGRFKAVQLRMPSSKGDSKAALSLRHTIILKLHF